MLRPALLAALAFLATPLHAQGIVDRLVGNAIGPSPVAHDTSPAGLAAQGVFFYDWRSDLSNMDATEMGPGAHLLVLTHSASGAIQTTVMVEDGAACGRLAVSMSRVHQGGWTYCHPTAARNPDAPVQGVVDVPVQSITIPTPSQ